MKIFDKHIINILCLLLLFTACHDHTLKVALLTDGGTEQQTSELTALGHILDSEKDITYEYLPIDTLTDLSHYDVVWYHRIDSMPISEQEKQMGPILTKYTTNGGKLILSMEAVRLLNTWQIEPEPIKNKIFDATDKGFGRKVGFHAYREHPLFDKLFGGAYTWHGTVDNQCRVLGFFGENKPMASTARVIGTLWEYIYYHPEDKILWETQLGKGSILAIGGFLYYNKENFHTEILNQFTHNCIRYLSDQPMRSKTFYWEKKPLDIKEEKTTTPQIAISQPIQWHIPKTQEKICWKATNTTIDLPSQKAVLIAKEKSGIEEIWVHPFLSLRDYRIWLDISGRDTLVSLDSYNATVELRPNAIIRTYQDHDFYLKEVLTSQIDNAVTIAHYEWKGNNIHRIIADYKSNLRFMWPYDEYALGTIFYHWSSEANAFIIHDSNKEFVSLIGANLPGTPLLSGRFDDFIYPNKKPQGIVTDKHQVGCSVSYNVEQSQTMDIFMIASNEGLSKVFNSYAQVIENPQSVFNTSINHYKEYLDNNLSITTPDSLFNEGFRWATISSAQFIVDTPGIGTSLMAGYSSSRHGWRGAHKISGRPGYAWYFGRDAIWSAFALTDIGDFTTVRKVLETLIRYQQIDGKIYHELTTSGSVHFDASDATPLFINLIARYLRASGDFEFVKKHMPAITKAINYCYSTDTDGDHLIEISNVGHGWLEGGDLYGSHTEFYLAGLWNAALNDAAYIASLVGDTVNKAKYKSDANIVNEIINKNFWNEKGYYNYGKHKDGSYTDECIVLVTVPVYMGVTDKKRSEHMMEKFASSHFSTDWGVRMINDSHPIFNPTAYHFGSVWPLFTGWTALAEYEVGRYIQGFSHIMANLQNYRGISHGRIPEVINGVVYKPSGVTLHQCWSETMVLQPIVEGMLGFAPDAPRKRLKLAPRLPFHWNTLQVEKLRIADTSISFNMKKEPGKILYVFSSTQPIQATFSPSFAPGSRVERVSVNGKEVVFDLLDNGEYMNISTEIFLDKTTQVEVLLHEGMSALPAYQLPQYGEISKGIRILSQKLTDKALEIIVEGIPGTTSSIELYLPIGYKYIEGVDEEIKTTTEGVHTFRITFAKTKDKYTTKVIKIYPPSSATNL